MTTYTADDARAIGPLPSTDEEVWRYSRIAELDLDAYHASSRDWPLLDPLPAPIEGALATVPVRGATVVSVNGRVATADIDVPGVDLDGDGAGSVMTEPTDVFAAMNGAFHDEPVVVRIRAGATIEAPI